MTLMVAGSLLTVWAQLAMGPSWRIGYDPSESTALVTRGPFRFVRNPIYTAMFVTMIGLALALPNVVSATLLAVSCVALEIQVRAVRRGKPARPAETRVEDPARASAARGARGDGGFADRRRKAGACDGDRK